MPGNVMVCVSMLIGRRALSPSLIWRTVPAHPGYPGPRPVSAKVHMGRSASPESPSAAEVRVPSWRQFPIAGRPGQPLRSSSAQRDRKWLSLLLSEHTRFFFRGLPAPVFKPRRLRVAAINSSGNWAAICSMISSASVSVRRPCSPLFGRRTRSSVCRPPAQWTIKTHFVRPHIDIGHDLLDQDPCDSLFQSHIT
jgi:hypothetical protein